MKTTFRNALMCLALTLPGGAAALAETPAVGKACPSSHNARYTMAEAEGFELLFQKAKVPMAWSDLEAVLTTPKKRYVFSLTASNGYSSNYLVLPDLPDDEGSFRFYGFDAELKPTELPSSGQPAALHYFIPELGIFLWYGQPEREFLPQAMWQLESCG